MDKLDMPERFQELSEERKMFLLDWITDNLTPIQSFNTRHTSYGLKQYIRNEYFTNGEFKGAMLESGYRVKDKNATNWVFNISERSPIIQKNKKTG